MAKKLVKNYFFTPGVGLDANLYPNAWSLISQNRTFILKEITAFVTNQVADAVKCERDLGYILDGARYDTALGTNYNAVFQGIAEYNSLEVTPTVLRTIQRARDEVLAISSVATNSTALTRATNYFNEVLDIAENGRANADAVTFSNPSTATSSQIAAKDRLQANKIFLAAEVNAWVDVMYPAHNHDVAKCARDVKYAIDSISYDILYGGNSATYDNAKFFFYFDAANNPGIDPTHKAQTVAAYAHLADVVAQVVQGITVTPSVGNTETQNTDGNNANSSDSTALEVLLQIIEDVVANGTTSLPGTRTAPGYTWAAAGVQTAATAIATNKADIILAVNGFKDYVFDEAKCERDSGYVLDALIHDLRYGGNEEIHRVASRYWDGDVPQIDGTRLAEYEAYYFTIDLINDYIIENTLDAAPEQQEQLQVIDLSKTGESAAKARVTELLTNVIDVIQNGLDSLPTYDVQLARVEVLGKVELEDLLLISNVTNNVVIYNFADPSKGGTATFYEGNTENYPNATTVNNGVTFIRFKTDCTGMLPSDAVQVFLENTELRVRPYDFGTDAIERMRVAQPQAMIDADFEYGLQPTKWQAIGMQRGYPATYEVSATDVAVVTVTTDASTGTSGVGSSLITVTTQGAHGFLAGTPITIRALAASITGFNRAEGTFIIYDVPSTTTFRYYAKAKVGTSSGQVLATSTTQLRQASFYTGASVGSPTFTVHSNGSSGSFVTALRTESGQNTIAFIGAAPPSGAPLTGTGINPGTQVSGVFGPSNSDGIVDYKFVKTSYGSGVSTIELVDVTDLSAGMAVGNEAAPNVLREISAIVGTTLTLNGAVTVGHLGDENTYIGSAAAVVGTGTSCTVDITVSGGGYTLDAIATAGSGYLKGDTLRVLGDQLGGTTPDNDAYINIDSVDGSGAILTATLFEGTGVGSAVFTGLTVGNAGSRGTGGVFTVVRANGVYTCTSYGSNPTSNYYPGSRFKITGSNFEGVDGTNDCILTMSHLVGSTITANPTASGTVQRGDMIPVYATITLSEGTTGIVSASATVTYTAIATVQVAFASNHGFVPGMGLNINVTSTGTNHSLASGPFAVEQIVNSTTIRYIARAPGTISTSTTLEGVVYVRPDTFFTHRPFDGGVMLGTGGPQHGGQAIRQSKKYIRYQSGKGAMYNTGALFAPSYDLRSVTAASTASGAVITVTTDDVDHGVQAGAVIKLVDIDTTGYNGTYTVNEIVDERSFRITASTQLGATSATLGVQAQMALVNWHGSVVRSGPFDDQNGIFFQYNGRELAVGRRSSTFQIAGTIAIPLNSNAITGTNTRFLDQLQEGDRIVIRGMTHVVSTIISNTSMTVTPDWRGVNAVSGVKVCKVQDTIIPQSEWNLDKCDGTGPSGYNIDITKMQMIGIQFSWYGAGFIDWMFRGPEGNYVFCHRLKGNNLNTEAYMRTGNLPVRYEVLNESAKSRLVGALDSVSTTMYLDNTYDFPTSGTVFVDNEIISYSGKNDTTNTLTGLNRAATLSNFAAGAVRSYTAGVAATHANRQGVVLISNTTSPIISHWGSAYLIDGNFDEDRGYIFSYASTGNSISTTKNTVFLIRLAPSVSNAVTGDLGEKELLNRAQLLLKSISISSDAQTTGTSGIVIEGVLNPQNYPLNPSDIGWGGLTALSQGGQPSFAQIAPGGSVVWSSGSSISTATATTTTTMSTTITMQFGSGTNAYMYVNATSWQNSNAWSGNYTTPLSGVVINDAKFPSNTTITGVQGPYGSGGTAYYVVYTSRNASSNVNSGASVTLNLGGNSASVTSQLFFTAASWTASAATTNTEVNDVKFPANTRVATVTGPLTFGVTSYYRVTFTQSSISSTSAGGTVTFQFGQPPYALPGETVFSFIANPGETATLDLNELKELTTTAIGGRGTFPNGPDVLAINVYKVAGSATNANIILRWGEAQA
jgi:hypothetical protein